MQHTIVLFGAGKSATVLIDYLIKQSTTQQWHVIIADISKAAILEKTKLHPNTTAIALHVANDVTARQQLVAQASIVLSLLPPHLHILVAQDCITYRTHLITASYTDDAIKKLEEDIKNKGILFLYEMGLDPGIDHMSAMQLINQIQQQGGNITSFVSHCGGLVAPDSDNNPWHYKISWNPANVVTAGQAGALYLLNHNQVQLQYDQLFAQQNNITLIHGLGELAYYPNRNSLPYVSLYGLQSTSTFIRTTLRYPAYMQGWQAVIALKLTNTVTNYNTDGLSLAQFFIQHITNFNLKDVLHNLPKQVKEQLIYLGFENSNIILNKGTCTAAQILQYALEQALMLQPTDKDMVVMQHEITYTKANAYTKNPQKYLTTSTLILEGENAQHTAMATTVGLPMGIAAALVLQQNITDTGLHIPTSSSIYNPVLATLTGHNIKFKEFTIALI